MINGEGRKWNERERGKIGKGRERGTWGKGEAREGCWDRTANWLRRVVFICFRVE